MYDHLSKETLISIIIDLKRKIASADAPAGAGGISPTSSLGGDTNTGFLLSYHRMSYKCEHCGHERCSQCHRCYNCSPSYAGCAVSSRY